MMTHVDGRVCCTLCVEYVIRKNAVAVTIPNDEDDDGTVAICRTCATAVRDALAAA